eukprot:gene22275-47629_t
MLEAKDQQHARIHPESAPSPSSPVCGTDGVIYDNACKAGCADTTVADANADTPLTPVFYKDGSSACVTKSGTKLVCKKVGKQTVADEAACAALKQGHCDGSWCNAKFNTATKKCVVCKAAGSQGGVNGGVTGTTPSGNWVALSATRDRSAQPS